MHPFICSLLVVIALATSPSNFGLGTLNFEKPNLEKLNLEKQGFESINVPNGRIFIEWKSSFSSSEKTKLKKWLSNAAETTSLVAGKFPLETTHVILKRYTKSDSSVPWAHTIRETNPEGVEFYVNPNASLKRLMADWTAVHEFSHLYLPFPGSRDIWIAEGFASYYQNILMARGGVQSEKQSWQKLADGFQRGAKNKKKNVKLKVLSRGMRRRDGTMRIYWSGALYFLEADLALRLSNQSLDSVLSQYISCCRFNKKYTNGTKLTQALDEISSTKIFTTQYLAYGNETNFRDYKAILAKLGVILDRDNRVLLDNSPYYKRLRESFMQYKR